MRRFCLSLLRNQLVLVCFLWGLPQLTYGQQEHVKLTRLPLPPDFAANSINRVLVDKKGFIWLFTLDNSFYRFDGNAVTPASDLFPKEILTYSTFRPFIDAENNLWLGDLEKMGRINLNTFELHQVAAPGQDRLGTKKIADITGVGSTIYVSTEEGKIFEHKVGRSFQLIVNVSGSLPNPSIAHIAVFESALYFTVANQGIFRRDAGGRLTRVRVAGTGPDSLGNCLWLQSDGESLFAQDAVHGLLRITQNRASQVGVGQTTRDWNLYPLQHTYFVRFLDNQTLIEKLVGNQLVVIDRFATSTRHREDKSGLFLRNSLGVYQIESIQRELFTEKQTIREFNTQHISIRHIARRRGALYLGTYEGFFKVNPSGQFQRLTSTIVYTSFEDRQGTVWLGTEGGGLQTLTQQDSIQPVKAINSLDNRYVTAIEALTETSLLVGTYQGFYVFDTRLKKWSHPVFTTDTYHLNESKIRKLCRLGNRIYIGSEKGLGFLDVHDPGTIHTLPGLPPAYAVYDVVLRDSTLWLATAGHGLTGYHLPDHSVESIEQGLAGPTAFNVLSQGPYLVGGTNAGLSLIDMRSRRTKNFTTKEGLPSNEFNQGAQWADGDRLYMGTIQGLVSLTINDLLAYQRKTASQPLLSSLVITSLSGNRHRELYTLAYQPDLTLDLSASERILAFQFGSLNVTDGTILTYRLNKQTQWTPISGRTLTLADLGTGLNQIRFRYQDETVERTFRFRVAPFFYETWWFIGLMVLLVVGLIYGYIRFRIDKIRKEQEIRVRISSDLHDELGGLLTGISMQADYLMYSDNKENQKKYLSQIASASKKATNAMSDLVWSIDARNDDWESLLARMREYAYTLLETANIQAEFVTDGSFMDKSLHPQARQNLYLFFKEVVNNLCKHARATQATIHLTSLAQQVVLTITDNGIGLTGDAHSSGQGMKNLQMRARRLRGSLTLKNRHPGLEVKLVVDLKKLPGRVGKTDAQ